MKTSNFHPLNWYPVAWITALIFAVLAWDTGLWRDGMVVCAIALLVVLFAQWFLRRLCGMTRCPRWLRRTMMLGPAILLAGLLYALLSPRYYVSFTLGGHSPWGLKNVLVEEDAWAGDNTIEIYFRSDPASLRRILENAPFQRDGKEPFTFADTPFAGLPGLPNVPRVIRYWRTDMGTAAKGSCSVCTDEEFSFAYIRYLAD